MTRTIISEHSQRLLSNSRFWILSFGVIASVCIAGIVQLLIPSGTLQIIRIEQIYGFIAVFLLLLALLISPLISIYSNVRFKKEILHARRAIGVLVFYYAFLHSLLAFTKQLGGFIGIQYYNSEYSLSLILGGISLLILTFLAVTSVDWAVMTMGFKRWKLLHRLVYISGITALVHMLLIGSHFEGINFLSIVTIAAVIILISLQALRIIKINRT